MGTDVVKWADSAMFEAQPMQKDARGMVTPRVYLLSATPDPLGALAAAYRMYAGYPTYDLADITDAERKQAWEDSLKTQLKAPWEFIDLHFFIEGVTRAFTHQMVRQRTAVYAQESLRFAVKEGLAQEVPLPPSLVSLHSDEPVVVIWQQIIRNIEKAYNQLINAGIPAEDARGLLPHATTTRLNYKTNYRNLVEVAGNRLCTQAQFEWRSVFLGIMQAIVNYRPALPDPGPMRSYFPDGPEGKEYYNVKDFKSTRWQFELLGSPRPETFSPICYKAGHCTFMGEIDRPCSIRDRVQTFAKLGVHPSMWKYGHERPDSDGLGADYQGIDPVEWMADPEAAR